MHFLIWILSGLFAGWIVGFLMKGGGYGIVGDVVLGILGGLVGGWLFRQFGVTGVDSGWVGQIFTAVVGGLFLVGLSRLLKRAT